MAKRKVTNSTPVLTDHDRWALEIFEMVRTLHDLGFQRLRVCAGPSIVTGEWSIAVTPSSNVMAAHGARIAGPDNAATHSIADDGALFGWRRIDDRSPEALAQRFLVAWPDVCADGKGRDWPYVGWYADFLRFARRGQLPASFENWGKSPYAAPQATVPLVAAATTDDSDQLPKPPGDEYARATRQPMPVLAPHITPNIMTKFDAGVGFDHHGEGRVWDHIRSS